MRRLWVQKIEIDREVNIIVTDETINVKNIIIFLIYVTVLGWAKNGGGVLWKKEGQGRGVPQGSPPRRS